MTTMVVPAQTNRPRLPSVRTETACCHREQQSHRGLGQKRSGVGAVP